MSKASITMVSLLLCLGLGCAGTSASECPSPAEGSPAEGSPAEGSPTEANPAVVASALPAWTNEGREIERVVLHEDPHLVVAAIALRRGTALPTHEVDSRISIQVLSGSGSLRVGEESVDVVPGSVLVIAAEAPHAMTPADDSLVVLLVHYLKG